MNGESLMTTNYLWTIVLSLIPVSELRGAIPYAYLNGIPLWQASVISILFNMLVPVIGFIFLGTLHSFFMKIKIYRNFFEKTIAKARNKVGEKVQKYGILGLMIFVAIPLPITGAWTGTLGAWVLGLDKKKSILTIALGVLIAGMIVTAVVLTGTSIGNLFTKTVNI